jgi:hypothetical protein
MGVDSQATDGTEGVVREVYIGRCIHCKELWSVCKCGTRAGEKKDGD